MLHRKSRFSVLSDEELMLHLCNGEVLAFDEIYYRYSKQLLGYFIRMLNFDKEMAEDALQDLFLKIAEHPEKFDATRSFKTWVFSIASNTCKNFYRHQKVVIDSREELSYLEGNSQQDAFLRTANRMDAIEFRRVLHEVLNELAPEKKEVFILKYQEDKSISEIAFIQGCPEGSVKSRLHYTLKILEEKLKIFNPSN